MRLTAIILLSSCLTASAGAYSQITLSAKDEPLQKVFEEMKKQSGYDFLCTYELLQQAGNVTIDVTNVSLPQALDACLRGKMLSYEIIDRTVVIKERAAEPYVESPPTPVDVSGRISDADGNALVGASIKVKGTLLGTYSNGSGEFTLKDVDPRATVEVSFVGYVAQEVSLKGSKHIVIVLKRNESALDQVQIIGYGTTTNRVNTGNVSTVNSEEIEKQPVDNPLLALEGMVPGLVITQSTGLPGTGLTVHVQGQNSMANGNDPLYVIDGVPYTSETLPTFGFILGGGGYNGSYGGDGNPLAFINPSDIESISVLKDADATAIYGSRAANGAILITTKKGHAGNTKIDVNVQNGWGKVTRFLDVMNIHQYLEMRREAFKNDGLTPGPTDYDVNGTWDTTRNINWQKVLLGGTSQYNTATMSVSGGNVSTQYLVSGTYQKQSTVFPGDFTDQKGSMNVNINSTSSDQKLKFQLAGNYLFDENRLPSYDYTLTATQLSPNAPDLLTKSGNINWALDSTGNPAFSMNPMFMSFDRDTRKTNNLISHALLSYQVFPGLEIKSSFGYTYQQLSEVQTFPLSAANPSYVAYMQRQANYENGNINSWIIEPQITYNRRIGQGQLQALVGSTLEQNNASSQQVQGSGYSSDLALQNIMAAATLTSGYNNVSSIYKYNAAFGRLNYNWKEKYIIDLTARRDGSSRFGSANQFHDFGAVGLGWVFSGEKFIKNALPALSFGKLTASYGTTGNDQIGDYKYMTLYSPTFQFVPYQGVPGLAPTGLPNPYLQWESTRKLYFSMNLGFLKDRILFNVGYANNRSSNQLLGYSLPSITGFYGVARNLPATVQNTSLELTLKATIVKSRDFNWTTNVNVTVPRNKLVAFPNLSTSGYEYSYTIGKTITGFKVFQLLGVDPATGVFEFVDHNGKPTFNPDYTNDATFQINMDPKFYGGFQNTLTYKSLTLSAMFQFVKQNGRTFPFGGLPGYYYGGTGNQPVWVLNRWQKPGDHAANQMFSTYASGNLINTFFDAEGSNAAYGDASFIRLRNVSLSWQLPASLINGTHALKSCELYFHAQNLLTITKFKGMDPESQSVNNSLPPLRVLTVGVRASL